MFSWICPTCGRDVPPSKTDCPYCADREKEAAALATQAPSSVDNAPPPSQAWNPPPPNEQQHVAPPPPPPPQQPPPPQHYAPPQYAAPQYAAPPQYAPQQYATQGAPPMHPAAAWHQAPPPRKGQPMWVMGLGFAAIFIAVIAGLYFGIQHYGATPAQKAGVENPRNLSRQKVTNPLQKYVEVVGVRIVTEHNKPTARFIVVNHSGAEINDLASNVTLWASDSRSEEDAVGSFRFSLPRLGPYESKDLSAPLTTRLKMYELPDWQNETAEIQITSPPAP